MQFYWVFQEKMSGVKNMLGTFAIFLNCGNIDIKIFKNTLPHLNSLLKIMNKYSIPGVNKLPFPPIIIGEKLLKIRG